MPLVTARELYEQLPNSVMWICCRCGSNVMAATVCCPIHRQGVYTRRDRLEQVPYCPRCERPSGWLGEPVYEEEPHGRQA